MRSPGVVVYSNNAPIAYAELHPGADSYALKLPRRYTQGSELRIDVVHSLFEPHGNLLTKIAPGNVRDITVCIRIPEFKGAPRPRNIMLANYGDASPDGAHVRDAAEVSEAYDRLHLHEYKTEGGQMDFVDRNERMPAGTAGLAIQAPRDASLQR
jgi:hypothetical protein